MNRNTEDSITLKQREMLVVMTALTFIEQNSLMTFGQLTDAKKSLQALFIRSSGEETMLRKLIDILRVNKDLHKAFSSISKISASISTSVEIISKKINYLKQYTNQLQLTPDESTEFFAPFLTFTHTFQEKIVQFNRYMVSYLELREDEAKRLHEFRIAQEASERLKNRLSGNLGAEARSEVEESMKQEVVGTFDYASAHASLMDSQRESKVMAQQIIALLQDIKAMCQMAMNPDMREKPDPSDRSIEHYDDIFARFSQSIRKFDRLQAIREFIIDYFKLYQRAFGMFMLDFDNFNKAVETISNNPDGYFGAKQEDEDIQSKRTKLKKYEGLIPFLETASNLTIELQNAPFNKFSKKISDVISNDASEWGHINEDLLVAKVSAEAELTTRLQD